MTLKLGYISFQVSSDRSAWNSLVDSLAGSHCVAYVFTNTRSIGIDWLFKYIGKSSLGKGVGGKLKEWPESVLR